MSKLVSCDECYSQKQYCEECSKIISQIVAYATRKTAEFANDLPDEEYEEYE